MPDTTDALLSAPPLKDIREQLAHSATAITRTTLSLSLATPMFGGGVKAGEVDLDQPFRPSAIRGQLRFWWRATSGARYCTPDKLFEAEARLWGDTSHASRVRLRVRNVDAKKKDTDKGWHPGAKRPQREDPNYVHFLISDSDMKAEQEGDKPIPERRLLSGSFDLDVEWSGLDEQQAHEAATAIRAWILFGGIGARTRRGCGTLFAAPLDGFDPSHAKESICKLFSFLPKGQARPWPTLKGGTLLLGMPGPSQDVWKKLIRLYAEFRQQRTPAPSRQDSPGRSYWPEPEAIREITGQRMKRHGRLEGDPKEFPRALLGLPIITQFKDEDRNDPAKTTLEAEGGIRRHASPLILKVLPVSKDRAIPMVLLLNTDIVQRLDGHLVLKGGKNGPQPGLHAGKVKTSLDIRAGIRATRKGRDGKPLTLREWFKQGTLGIEEVTL